MFYLTKKVSSHRKCLSDQAKRSVLRETLLLPVYWSIKYQHKKKSQLMKLLLQVTVKLISTHLNLCVTTLLVTLPCTPCSEETQNLSDVPSRAPSSSVIPKEAPASTNAVILNHTWTRVQTTPSSSLTSKLVLMFMGQRVLRRSCSVWPPGPRGARTTWWRRWTETTSTVTSLNIGVLCTRCLARETTRQWRWLSLWWPHATVCGHHWRDTEHLTWHEVRKNCHQCSNCLLIVSEWTSSDNV